MSGALGDEATAQPPSPADIHQAAALLTGIVRHTPLLPSEWLSEMLGRPVYLKLETLQATGSFKVRGAVAALEMLDPTLRRRGVITASAGNHGMGVAWAARRLGVGATVVVPRSAVAAKVAGLRRLGARVVLHGATYAEAHDEALRLVAAEDLRYIHAFTDPWVIAGQASVTIEVLADLPETACLVMPIGGGGLIGGAGLALAGASQPVRLVGVQARRADGMARSLRAGAVQPWRAGRPTLADGLAGSVEPLTLDLCLRYVAQVAVVRERELLAAIGMLLTRDHVLAEGSGAAGVAALASGRVDLPDGGPIVVVISGGNVDALTVTRALRAGAARRPRDEADSAR